MAQAAKKVTNIAEKKKGEKLFTQRAKYLGTTKSLTVMAREQKGGKYVVLAQIETTATKKKQKGAFTEHPNRESALAKFAELGEQAVAAGWKLKVGGSAKRSEFDVIPAAD